MLRLITYRPFPEEALYEALKGAQNIVVIEKAISLGGSAPLAVELRSVFHGRPASPKISGFVIGLGGRDVTTDDLKICHREGSAAAYKYGVHRLKDGPGTGGYKCLS